LTCQNQNRKRALLC